MAINEFVWTVACCVHFRLSVYI
eukprot:SAG31_NODE_42320_length_272_cov_0.601156_1_plen_22_part_10